MRKNIPVPDSKPRNPVVMALVRLARAGHGQHAYARRVRDHDRKDLDQRVRECGEW